MNSQEIKKAASAAIVKILRPLIKILLKNNIPYGTFAELVKWVYIDVTLNDAGKSGKKTSISHASIITGLSRKEISKIKDSVTLDDLGGTNRFNRAERVIGGWCSDPLFLDTHGKPLILPLDGNISFAALVGKYSGDVPSRALLKELLKAGVVENRDEQISLVSHGYIVKDGDIEKLNILGVDAGGLISTIHHNLHFSHAGRLLQRKVYYDNISEEDIPMVKEEVTRLGIEFLELVNKAIAKYDRDISPEIKNKAKCNKKGAGLGLFYME